MENLDEFMRQKFNSDDPGAPGRFEFREEYWEQARVLIEADQKRRRRRGLLWWWLFTGLLIAVGVWQWYGGSSSGSGSGQEELAGKGRAGGGDTVVHGAEGLPKGGPERSGNQSEETPENNGGSPAGTSEKNTAGRPGHGKTPSGAEAGPAGQKYQDRSDRSAREKRTQGPALTKSGPAAADRPPNRAPKPADLRPGQAVPALPGAGTAPGGTDKKTGVSGRDQAESSLRPQNGFDAPGQAADTAGTMEALAFLPVLLQQIDLPVRAVRMKTADAKNTAIEPVRIRRWQFGLAGYGTLLKTSPDGKNLGAAAGISVSRRLTPEWSIVSGLYWRFLPGNWRNNNASKDTSSQLQYAFGYKLDRWELKTSGLHFVELPLGISWRRGVFGAEAGLSAGYLTAVQGTLEKRHSESLQNGVSEERSPVTLDRKPYRSGYFAPYLGGEWRFHRHLSLSLRGVYQPGSLAKKESDLPPPGNLLRFDAGLKWLF